MSDDTKLTSLITSIQKLSRRGFMEKSLTGAVLVSAGSLSGWVSRAEAQAKVTKASARYKDKPNKGQQCAGCVNFVGPSDCKIVQGPISPNGWCSHFKGKDDKQTGAPARSAPAKSY